MAVTADDREEWLESSLSAGWRRSIPGLIEASPVVGEPPEEDYPRPSPGHRGVSNASASGCAARHSSDPEDVQAACVTILALRSIVSRSVSTWVQTVWLRAWHVHATSGS